MDDVVERVARAIGDTNVTPTYTVNDEFECPELLREMAKAAIAAIPSAPRVLGEKEAVAIAERAVLNSGKTYIVGTGEIIYRALAAQQTGGAKGTPEGDLIAELRHAEGLTGPHSNYPGKESSLHREGLLLDAAHEIERLRKANAVLRDGLKKLSLYQPAKRDAKAMCQLAYETLKVADKLEAGE